MTQQPDSSPPHRLGLVLSGGGILGIAHIGMLKALDEHGLLDGIDVAVGTSAGALMAALFALGYTPDGMWEIWQRDAWRLFGGKVDANVVQDRNWQGALDALVHWDWTRFRGLLRGEKLALALRTYLVRDPQGTGVRPTRPARPLLVVATNYNTGQQTVWRFTHHIPPVRDFVEAAPPALALAPGRVAHWQVHDEDDPAIARFPTIAEAVRCSISIPFVFVPAQAPTLYQGQQGPDDTLYVDGGVHDNYSLSAAVKLAGCDRVIGLMLAPARPYVRQGWTGLIAMAQRIIDQMGRTLFEADQDDALLRETNIRTLVPRLPATGGTFDVAAMPAIYAAGLDVTREFLQRVGETAGRVTWDTIFATRQLNPAPGEALPPLRNAARDLQPGWPDLAAPDVRYYVYDKLDDPGP
jgi:predicted acylesterase/phospholipase RssA